MARKPWIQTVALKLAWAENKSYFNEMTDFLKLIKIECDIKVSHAYLAVVVYILLTHGAVEREVTWVSRQFPTLHQDLTH